MSTARALLVVGVAMIVLAVGAGYWFVTEYDTAAARCQRGDLGACSVIQAQAQAEAAAAAEAAGERDAALQAAIDEAIALEDDRAQQGRCYLRLRGHDATMRVSGLDAEGTCGLFADFLTVPGEQVWEVVTAPGASRVICTLSYGGMAGETQTITFLDSGSAHYAGVACDQMLHSYD